MSPFVFPPYIDVCAFGAAVNSSDFMEQLHCGKTSFGKEGARSYLECSGSAASGFCISLLAKIGITMTHGSFAFSAWMSAVVAKVVEFLMVIVAKVLRISSSLPEKPRVRRSLLLAGPICGSTCAGSGIRIV